MQLKYIFTFLIPLTLASCGYAGQSDPFDTIYADSMGFSLSDGSYTAVVCGSRACPDGNNRSVTVKGVGSDPISAVRNAGAGCGNDIFYGHCSAVVLDSAALCDKELYYSFTDSVISPACAVYYSPSPSVDTADISSRHGFSEKLFHAAAECIGDQPVTVPCADDPFSVSVSCGGVTHVFPHDDSYGIMLLCGREYPLVLTVPAENGRYSDVLFQPKISRSVSEENGQDVLEITVSSDNADMFVRSYIEDVCRSAFEKTVLAGIDAPGISRFSADAGSSCQNDSLRIIFRNARSLF